MNLLKSRKPSHSANLQLNPNIETIRYDSLLFKKNNHYFLDYLKEDSAKRLVNELYKPTDLLRRLEAREELQHLKKQKLK